MNTEWNHPTKYIVGVGLALFGLYMLYISLPVIPLLTLALLIAFVLMPIVDFFCNQLKMPRGLAVFLAYLLLTIVLLISPLILIPRVISGFRFLLNIDYQSYVNQIVQWTETMLLSLKEMGPYSFLGFNINLDPLVEPALRSLYNTEIDIRPFLPSVDMVINSLQSAVTITYGLAANVMGTVFSGMLAVVVVIVSAIYISLDAPKFAHWFLEVIPHPHHPEVATLLQRIQRVWRAYLRGQLNLMIIVGLITWAGNAAIGLPGAFVLGVIAGGLEVVPHLGPVLMTVPAVIIALIQGSTYLPVSNLVFALIVILLYVVIQQVENAVIVPVVLGDAVDLHPLVVLFGVIIGASTLGILGALLAAPIIATTREIMSYLYAKLLGLDPYPPQPEQPEQPPLPWLKQANRWLEAGKKLFDRLRPLPEEKQTEAAKESDTSKFA